MGTKAQEVYLTNKLKNKADWLQSPYSYLIWWAVGGEVKDKERFRIKVKEVKVVKGLA